MNPLRNLPLLVALMAAAPASPAPASTRTHFVHLTAEQGLSDNNVRSIYQDADGYMWFCTQDGLNRFDGHRFVVYQGDPADPGSIAGNWVDQVVEDDAGDLWIFLGVGGVDRLARGATSLQHYRHEAGGGGLASNSVTDFALHPSGDRWIATLGGVDRVPAGDGRPQPAWRPAGEPSAGRPAAARLHISPDGTTWVASSEGILRSRASGGFDAVGSDHGDELPRLFHEGPGGELWLLTQEGGLYRYHRTVRRFLAAGRIEGSFGSPFAFRGGSTVAAGAAGRLWLAPVLGHPLRLDPSSGRVDDPLAVAGVDSALAGASIGALLEDSRGQLWVGTQSRGAFRFDPASGRLDRFRHRPTDPQSLGGDTVNDIREDRAGLIWFALQGRGISCLDPRKEEFALLRHDPGRPDGLPDTGVNAVAEDEHGRLWIGTRGGGLHAFDPGREELVASFRARDGQLPHDTVNAVLAVEGGVVLVGTAGGGLVVARPGDNAGPSGYRFAVLRAATHGLLNDNVLSLAPALGGGAWVGYGFPGGIDRLDPTWSQVQRLHPRAGDDDAPPPNSTWVMLQEDERTLWVGAPSTGLSRHDLRTGERYQYPWDPDDPTTLNNRTVNSLLLDRQGELWVGTYSGGLDRLDRESGHFVHLTRRQGLPSNMVNGIVEDTDGQLWLATNHGLCRYDPRTGRVHVLDSGDGLHGLQFLRGTMLLDRQGRIVVGGEHGLNLFHPERLHRNLHVPPVAITSFSVLGEERMAWGAELSREARLDHDQNFVSFEFAALDYANPGRHRFRYRLAGLDRGWTEAGGRRVASYPSLPPGHFRFELQGSNGDGVWNRDGASVPFTIVPPFWQTRGFRGGVALSLLLLISGGVWLRLRRAAAQRRELEATVREKTAELREKNLELERMDGERNELVRIAAHEMRTPLTSLVAYLGLTIDQLRRGDATTSEVVDDLIEAQGASMRVADLLSGMLDIAAIEQGRLQIDPVRQPLGELLEERCRFHERVARQKGIALGWSGTGLGLQAGIDRARMGEVLDNLLSNAIKYTYPGGRVELLLREVGGAPEFLVRDSGQGLTREDLSRVFGSFQKLSARPTAGEASSGLGLAIVKKLVELHGGEVWVESTKGEGSTFGVRLPAAGTHALPPTPASAGA